MAATGGQGPSETAREVVASGVISRDLLSPQELADRWGVTTGHLANLRHEGQGIGYLKLGSRVAYRLADVLQYEDSVYVPVPVETARVVR